jgi:hypothetical protein
VTDRYVLTTCKEHPDCTVRADFVEPGGEGFDPAVDLRPVAAWVQVCAEEAFGSVFCVDISHLPGKLTITGTEL